MSTQARSSKRRRSGADGAFCGGKETGKRSLYHCNYCQRNISDSVRIKCAVCMDFDLCVECFSVGVELGEHKNTHSYRVMDFLAFPLHHPAWGADEELLLLEGIDMYGIGNWQAVSEHVGEKNAEACKQHYYQIYVESPAAPLPTAVPELHNVPIAELTRRQLSQGTPPATRPAPHEPPTKAPAMAGASAAGAPAAAGAVAAPAAEAGTALSEEGVTAPAPTEDAPKVQAEPQPAKAPVPTPSTTPPLAPRGRRRGARASTAAATAATDAAMAMHPGGTTGAAETAGGAGAAAVTAGGGGGGGAGTSGRQPNAKVETSGYMRFRDEFDPDYDGDAEHPIANLDFLETDTPDMVSAKVRMLQIYNERLDERERRREMLKRMGHADVRKLQAAEKKKTPYERRLSSALRVFERFQTPQEAEALGSGLLQEAQLRARIATLQQLRRLGARTFAAGEAIQADLKRREQIAGGRARPGRPLGTAADSSNSGGGTVAQIPPSVAATLGPPLGLPQTSAVQVAQWKGRRASPLDISQMPGASSLTDKERDLCTTHRLLPGHWLLLKETMMREDARRGGTLTRSIARNLFRLEPARATRLFDLAISQGWVGSGKVSALAAGAGTSGTAPIGVKAIEASAVGAE